MKKLSKCFTEPHVKMCEDANDWTTSSHWVLLRKCRKDDRPFLICKWRCSSPNFEDSSNIVYSLEVMTQAGFVVSRTIDREMARHCIKEWNLPELYRMSKDEIIWGHPKFREVFIKKGRRGYNNL